MTPVDCGVSDYIVFDLLQGPPLSGQELCDAYAVPGPTSPAGSTGIMGENRQSEVSHVFITPVAALSVG